jgi:RND family efflux transporter MFP subunit
VAEPISRTYTVKITVNNPEFALKPGMVCDVQLNTGESRPSLVVPYQAVSKGNDGKCYVFLVNPDQSSVKKQPVSIGSYIGDRIEIINGLKEGEIVVTGGIEKLFDNCLIEK